MSRVVVVIALAAIVVGTGRVEAGTDPVLKCVDSKAKVAGKKAQDLLKALGKNLAKNQDTKLASNISKAQSKFTKGFTKAESKGACIVNGDAAAIEAKVDAFAANAVDSISSVTFTWTQVQSLFVASGCATFSCHGNGGSQAGLSDLDDYDLGYAELVGTASTQLPTMDRVLPGDSLNSYLMHKLDGTQAGVGGSGAQMPIGPPLGASDRDGIRGWIDSGAPKN